MVNKKEDNMYNYNESINLLINRFPKLKSIYEENIDDYKDLPYVFYESVFVKYVMDKVHYYDEVELSTIFSFVEDLLLNGDEKTKNLIDVAVIESLYYEKDFAEFNKSLLKFYGKLTKKSFEDCFAK